MASLLAGFAATACQDAPLQPETAPDAGEAGVFTDAVLEIQAPADGATLSGTVRLLARLKDVPLARYAMTWQLDGGAQKAMTNATNYKRANVDVTRWPAADSYVLTFTATNAKTGKIVTQASVRVKRATATTSYSVAITPSTAAVKVGESTPLSAKVVDGAGSPVSAAVTWTTSNAAVAKVDAQGKVTGVSAGTAIIGAAYGTSSATATVTVSAVSAPPPPSTNPFDGVRFYVDPNSNAKKTADSWRASRPADAAQMDKIAKHMQADWFGEWSGNVYDAAMRRTSTIASAGALPVFVAYNIPQRDCGGYSAGGTTVDAYRTWITNLANGIGSRRAAVILEPDALAGMDCLSSTDQQTRVALLHDAIRILKSKPGILVYVDAGNPNWISAPAMADRLRRVGIDAADGFALNVSNFHTTASNISYGQAISALIGGKHFVIDTSRNGLGSNGEWCNPSGRALGYAATASTGNALVDAFLWLKRPGESDGTCNGGPAAGSWWASYALGLAQRSSVSGALMASAGAP